MLIAQAVLGLLYVERNELQTNMHTHVAVSPLLFKESCSSLTELLATCVAILSLVDGHLHLITTAVVVGLVYLIFQVLAFNPFGEDDPFQDAHDDWLSPPAPVTVSTIITVQSSSGSIPTIAFALARDIPAGDKVEQHVLHSIFADGVAFEVPVDVEFK